MAVDFRDLAEPQGTVELGQVDDLALRLTGLRTQIDRQ